MAPTRASFEAAVAVGFGVFLVPVAAGNLLVGSRPFGVTFGALAFVFLSFGVYRRENSDRFDADGDEPVPEWWLTAVKAGTVLAVFVATGVVVALVR